MADIIIFIILFVMLCFGFGLVIFFINKWRIDQRQDQEITRLKEELKELLRDIGGRVDNTSKAMYQQISSFTKETVGLREEIKRVQEEMKNISSFQEIFRTPKLRGEWGEANLEYILSEFFPKELYIKNYTFTSGAQVEFAIKLPNKKILPVDAKFFSDNFKKLKEAKTEEEKNFYRKKFVQDVKFNINEISSKYINPSENTVDFALMFIPAEAIFYEITFDLKDEDVANYARSRKIILTSPNTIYLTLRTILDWYRDIQVSQKTQEILKRLNKIQTDAEKLAQDFKKLGSHLKNATSAYENSEKRLSLFTQRVERLLEIPTSQEKLLEGSNKNQIENKT
ncbi:MAG: DNA recombination protein RmuC [Candidatus Pacebacteria bacterium]|nr:DNA recombination protein RmuC [Candidatus Paceibacterota bacterium]